MKKKSLTWKIINNDICFSDGSILCSWLHLGENVNSLCLEGSEKYTPCLHPNPSICKKFHVLDMTQAFHINDDDADYLPVQLKHFQAIFSDPLNRILVNVGMRNDDPFIVLDQKVNPNKPLTFLEFILQVRSVMTYELSEKEYKKYRQHTAKYFFPDPPDGKCYYELWHSVEEPFLFAYYKQGTLLVDWTR